MQTVRLNQWLSVGANLGVLGGIILLIVELDQNSDLARLQLEDNRRSIFQQGEFAIYGDSGAEVWAKSVMDPASLSVSEIRILDAYLVSNLNRSQAVHGLENAGLRKSGAALQYMKSNLPYDFGNHYAQLWWKYEKQYWPSGFVEKVDSVMAEISPTLNRTRILGLQRDIAHIPPAKNGN